MDPAPVPPVPTPAPPASPTDHSSHSSHTRPPPFNVSSLGDGRELRRRTRATSLLPAAEAPGRRAADGTDVCMPGGGAAEEGTNTAAALASLLAERVDLLERVDQLERGLEDLVDLVAQVNHGPQAKHGQQQQQPYYKLRSHIGSSCCIGPRACCGLCLGLQAAPPVFSSKSMSPQSELP